MAAQYAQCLPMRLPVFNLRYLSSPAACLMQNVLYNTLPCRPISSYGVEEVSCVAGRDGEKVTILRIVTDAPQEESQTQDSIPLHLTRRSIQCPYAWTVAQLAVGCGMQHGLRPCAVLPQLERVGELHSHEGILEGGLICGVAS